MSSASYDYVPGPVRFRYARNAFGVVRFCPHASDQHVHLSGSRVREHLAHGEPLPLALTKRYRAFSRIDRTSSLMASVVLR